MIGVDQPLVLFVTKEFTVPMKCVPSSKVRRLKEKGVVVNPD